MPNVVDLPFIPFSHHDSSCEVSFFVLMFVSIRFTLHNLSYIASLSLSDIQRPILQSALPAAS